MAADGTTEWRCADGYEFTVRYEGQSAVVGFYGRTATLPQAASGSGARYSDGNVTLWEHQGTARLDFPGVSHADCRPR